MSKKTLIAFFVILIIIIGIFVAYRPGSDVNLYVDKDFGFSFEYPKTSVVSTGADGVIKLSVQGSENTISIKKSVDFADDSTGKWGKFVISFKDGGWTVEQNNQDDSLETTKLDPMALTNSRLPIFPGGIRSHGWGIFDYIVPLSQTKYLIISGPDNLTDSPYSSSTDPTLLIVKSVSAI